MLAFLLFDWQLAGPPLPAEIVPIALVPAETFEPKVAPLPSPAPAPVEHAAADRAEPAASAPAADLPERPGAEAAMPMTPAAPPAAAANARETKKPERRRAVKREANSTVEHADPLKGEDRGVTASPGVAIYSVALEAAGRIRAVDLVQSSGSPAYDQAGEIMIRTSMRFPPTAAAPAGDEVAYFAVRLQFSPDGR